MLTTTTTFTRETRKVFSSGSSLYLTASLETVSSSFGFGETEFSVRVLVSAFDGVDLPQDMVFDSEVRIVDNGRIVVNYAEPVSGDTFDHVLTEDDEVLLYRWSDGTTMVVPDGFWIFVEAFVADLAHDAYASAEEAYRTILRAKMGG